MSHERINSKVLGLLTIVVFLLLQGCESIAPRSSFPDEGILLDHVNAQAKGDTTWFDAADLNREILMLQYKGELSPSIAFYLERELHIHDDPELSAYLLRIIDRLLESWEGERPGITVVIESDEFFNAFISEYNQMHISTAVFRMLENEDQLASLIAHEISHVLLNHNHARSVVRSTLSALEFGELLAADVGSFAGQVAVNSDVQRHSEYAALGFSSMGFIWAELFAPNWSRQNEMEADRLGLDLVMRANYNYEEFPVMLEKIYDVDTKRSERLRNVSDKIDVVLQNNLVNPGSNQWERIVDTAKVKMATRAKNMIIDEIAHHGREHEDRETRIDALKSYINAEYDDDFPPETSVKTYETIINSRAAKNRLDQDMKANKVINALNNNDRDLARSKARNLQVGSGNYVISGMVAKATTDALGENVTSAINNLSRLIREREHAPSEVYKKLAELYTASENYAKAEAVLQTGIERVGRDYTFLPTLIYVNKAAGDMEKAEENTLECQKYDLGRQQSIVRRIIGASDVYYEKCAAILGYDVRAQNNSDPSLLNNVRETLDKPINQILNLPFGRRDSQKTE